MTTHTLRILLSYHYFKTVDLDALIARYFPGVTLDIFADSGAFSAMTQGVTINRDAYAAWLARWRHRFTVYANLDVIRNAEQTWENQVALEAHGLSPLPVFHVLEAWDWLERYLDRYSYIGLGVAGSEQAAYWPWVVQCFQRAQGRTTYHGFGITSLKTMAALPWRSLDSSSWGQGFRYGSIPLWDSERARFWKVQQGDRASVYGQARLIRSYGFDPEIFCASRKDAKTIRQPICAISALSYRRLETWLQARHDRALVDRVGGVRLIQADTDPVNHALAVAGRPSVYLADDSATEGRRGGRLADVVNGAPHVYLADTSHGVNYRDAVTGVRLYLADSNYHPPDLESMGALLRDP